MRMTACRKLYVFKIDVMLSCKQRKFVGKKIKSGDKKWGKGGSHLMSVDPKTGKTVPDKPKKIGCVTIAVTDKDQKLTNQERNFAELYVEHDFSAIKAGMLLFGKNCMDANVRGSRMAAKPNVKAYIQELAEQKLISMGWSRERVIEEWLNILGADLADFVQWGYDNNGKAIMQLTPSDKINTKAVKSVKMDKNGNVEISLYDKMTALKNIGEMLDLYPKATKMELIDSKGGDVQINIVRERIGEKLERYSFDTSEAIEVLPIEVRKDGQ